MGSIWNQWIKESKTPNEFGSYTITYRHKRIPEYTIQSVGEMVPRASGEGMKHKTHYDLYFEDKLIETQKTFSAASYV